MTHSLKNRRLTENLSPKRRKEIDALVESVRKKLQYDKPPMEVGQIEIFIPEIQIAEIPHSPIASEIFYLDRIRKIAQLNVREKDAKPQKILAICHALGHYFLHTGEEFGCRLDFYGEINVKEAEAIYFAESLLMPNEIIREMYGKMADEYDPIYKLAKCFSVSRQVIEERLTALELL